VHGEKEIGYEKTGTGINSEGVYYMKDSSFDGTVKYFKLNTKTGKRNEISKTKFEKE